MRLLLQAWCAMADAHIRSRVLRKGELRFDVRYRTGRHDKRQHHAGTFTTLPEAQRALEHVRLRLAGGRLPETKPVVLRASQELVYFARLGDLVKIGVSVDPESRARSLNVELVLVLPGGRSRERQLQRRFSTHHVRGEWFRYVRPIRLFVARQGRSYDPLPLPPPHRRRPLRRLATACAHLLGAGTWTTRKPRS